MAEFDNEFMEPYEGNEPFLFVSYARKDREDVNPIIARLNKSGYRVWYDNGIVAGQNFATVIADKIEKCTVFLAMLTPNYMASQICMKELSYGFQQGKTMIGIRLTQFQLPNTVSFLFGNTVFLDKYVYTEPEFYSKLFLGESMGVCRKSMGSLPPPLPPDPDPPKKPWLYAVLGAVAVAILALFIFKPSPPFPEQNPVEEQKAAQTEEESEENSIDALSISVLDAEPENYKAIPFGSADASTELNSGGVVYMAARAIDGHRGTAWIESVKGDGIGESLELYLDKEETISGLCINPGFSPYFADYGRPRTLRLIFADGQSVSCTLEDKTGNAYLLFSRAVTTDSVTVMIEDVYPGGLYDETGITEISAFRQQAPTVLVLSDVPCAADLDAIGANVVYPRKDSFYLKEYKYGETIGSTNAFMNPNAANVMAKDNYYRLKGGEKVVVLAEGSGYSCVIVESTLQAAWIKTDSIRINQIGDS